MDFTPIWDIGMLHQAVDECGVYMYDGSTTLVLVGLSQLLLFNILGTHQSTSIKKIPLNFASFICKQQCGEVLSCHFVNFHEGDLISCLESAPSEEVDLRDLSVTLDIMCLTLPPDLDFMQDVGDLDDEDTYRGPSFTEHSPPTSPCPENHDHTRANTLSTSDAGE